MSINWKLISEWFRETFTFENIQAAAPVIAAALVAGTSTQAGKKYATQLLAVASVLGGVAASPNTEQPKLGN